MSRDASKRSRTARLRSGIGTGILLVAVVAVAQEPVPEQDPEPADAPAVAAAEPADDAATDDAAPDAADETADAQDPCAPPVGDAGKEWIDRMRKAVYRSVCGSANWFDSFFGAERVDRERDATFGRVGLAVEFDERDGLDGDTRFKAKVALPRLEQRWNAFVGRYDTDDFVAGVDSSYDALPQAFAATDQDWLFGLGYNPVSSRRSRLDIDGGIKLGFPSNPFVRARYRYNLFASDTVLLRLRETAFWRRDERFGATTQVDLEQVLSARRLQRWTSYATVTQESDGLDWLTRYTLYQALGTSGKRAIAYQLEVDGETDRPEPIVDYGLRAIYRQQYRREWLFLELRASVTWPKYEIDEERSENFGVSVGFEMLFGDHPWGG